MKIRLNNEIQTAVRKGSLKTVTLVNYLLDNGFKSDKIPFETALKDMSIDDKYIKAAYIKGINLVIEF